MVSIDKTDGIQVVGVKSEQASIVIAKPSEMNILVPTHIEDFVSLLFILVYVVCCVWADNYFTILVYCLFLV
jgi:hypothetical protein